MRLSALHCATRHCGERCLRLAPIDGSFRSGAAREPRRPPGVVAPPGPLHGRCSAVVLKSRARAQPRRRHIRAPPQARAGRARALAAWTAGQPQEADLLLSASFEVAERAGDAGTCARPARRVPLAMARAVQRMGAIAAALAVDPAVMRLAALHEVAAASFSERPTVAATEAEVDCAIFGTTGLSPLAIGVASVAPLFAPPMAAGGAALGRHHRPNGQGTTSVDLRSRFRSPPVLATPPRALTARGVVRIRRWPSRRSPKGATARLPRHARSSASFGR